MRIIQGGYGQQVGASITGTTQGSATNRSARDGAAGAQQPETASAEKVTLSAKARQLADKSAAADSQQVERLRSAIDGGTFKVDRAAIAKRIVDGE